MDKKSLKNIEVAGKKVLVRVDFNVPMDDAGNITDDTRIVASLETINYLLQSQAAVILMAHFGRPKGKVNAKYSLAPVAKYLSELIHQPVAFAEDCIGPKAEEAASQLQPGQVLLLENLRFHSEEEADDMEFAEQLASLADMYVNDGFGVSHRAHASVEGVTHYLPAAAGFLLEKEIQYLGNAVKSPARPFVAIIGGAKVSDKIGVIENLLNKVDALIIGGGMANTFLAAQGYKMGKSLIEADKLELAKQLLAAAKAKGVRMLLPVDMVMAEAFAPDAKHQVEAIDSLNQDYMALDIGPQSAELFAAEVLKAKTIVWNGPMGVFEMDAFCKGTEKVAEAMAKSKGITIVGGGDSVAAIEKLGLAQKIKHISTGGGASLEYLEGKILPGIASLDDLRRPMIAGNWKMHKNVDEALELAENIVTDTYGCTHEIVIFPPFTALETIAAAIDGKEVGYGAQNLYQEANGAFTGEISGSMLNDIGCQYVLVGHSERRTIMGESNKLVAAKVQAAFANDLIPMLCVGENLEERENDKTERKIAMQLTTALKELTATQVSSMIIAYEPIWAIGTGMTASSEDAEVVCKFIRAKIAKMFGTAAADAVRILYGGSVKAANAHSFHVDGIDGVLVGGASLEASSFADIARNF